MKKTLLVLFSFFIISLTQAQQIRVLFLGNSFTYVYDVDQIFKQLAIEAGVNIYVDRYADAGIALGTWTGNSGHNLLSGSLNAVSAGNWDYVIVQDNLGIWIGNTPYQEGYDDVIENLNNIKTASPCAQVIYFAGWCPEGGVQSGDNTQGCGTRIYNNFVNINDNGGIYEIVSPVAKSWNTALTQYPGTDLYYSDNTHASINGAYLAASTLFVSILKKDIRNLSFRPTNWWDGSSISSTTASNFRTIAWNEVTSRMAEANLDEHTPTISANGNILTASGSGFMAPYQWYLNGNPISGANSISYTSTSNGTYTVSASNSSGCTFSSFEYEMMTTSIQQYTKRDFQLKNMGSNQYEIVGDIMGTIYVYNLQGKLVTSNYKNEHTTRIDLRNNAKGLYMITLISDNQKITKKVSLN
jgi:Secretion system C-terminal sorting domain